MDEVDFTVLAATSVFTDLSEKCPPAEACRDAIERTARATIRMANSTGGFGQQMVPPPSIARQPSTGSSRANIDHREWAQRMDAAARGTRNQRNRHRSPPPPPQRQQSHHQYSLPGITDAYDNVSSGAQLPPIQNAAVAGGPYRNNSFSRNVPQDQGSSPDTSAIDPSLLPSPNNNISHNNSARTPPAGVQQHQHSSMTSPGSNSLQQNLLAAFITQSQAPSQAGAYSLADDMSGGARDLQMDFLQQASLGAMNGGGGLVGDDAGNVDLGMGLGWEGLHHDFSDGQQYDLFDGFFFGGQQGGGGGMGGANGGL